MIARSLSHLSSAQLRRGGPWSLQLTEWRTHLPFQYPHHCLVLHVIHQIQADFDGRQDDRAIGVLQPNRYPLGQLLGIHVGLGDEGEEGVKDVYLAPSTLR